MSRKRKKKDTGGAEPMQFHEASHEVFHEPFHELSHEEDVDELGQAILNEDDAPVSLASIDRAERAETRGSSSSSDELFATPHVYPKTAPLLHRVAPVVIGVIITLALVGGAGSLFVASQFLNAKNEAARVQASFDSIKESVARLDFRTALAEFPKGEASIRSLTARVSRFSFLSWVPFIGSRINETQKSLRVLEEYFTAGERLLAIIDEIGSVIFTHGDKSFELYMRSLSQDDKAAILSAITKAVPTVQGVQATLRLARLEMGQIDTRALSGELVKALVETKAGGEYLQSVIDAWLPLAEALPSFLGYPDEKTYLILLQDTSEVRATGGFISYYGILKLHNGEITLLKTDNVYNLDDHSDDSISIPPPEPFASHFPSAMKRWYLRDSNWAPDFSESARQAALFYRLEGKGDRIDGVIAATPELVRSLLQFTGPIRVSGHDYTADTFMQQLELEVREGQYRRGIDEAQRKEIFGELVTRIGEKIVELPLTRWLELYTTIETRLNEKQVLMYFTNTRLQEFARSRFWTGEIRPFPGDSLMVVDTTFATLKTEGVMDKRMSYTLREDQDKFLVARLDLTYTNRATFSDVTTSYRDWVRVYVPDGSTLISATGVQSTDSPASTGTLEITKRYGKLEFAGYLTVEPRHTKVVTIEYRLPNSVYQQVRAGTYSLLLQKQPGLSNQRIDGHLEFQAPIESYQPLGFFNVRRAEDKLDIFHDYRTDQEFTVTLKKKE